MHIIQAKNYDEMSRICADLMRKDIDAKADIEICLATGASPKQSYHYLVEDIQKDKVDTTRWKIVKLDEWVGLDADAKATCEWFLQEYFIRPLHLQEQFISFSCEKDASSEAQRIQAYLAKHPLDLCILGFGKNGHLGLNEPSDALHAESFVCELSASSQTHAMLEEENRTVTQGVTIGMKNILDAKHIILLLHGKEKVALCKEFLSGKITTQLPASFLWLHDHVDVIVCMDEFAEIADLL